LPNPYRLVENWPTLPGNLGGGRWGELIRADIDRHGNIWVFHRCFNTEPAGNATCVGRTEPPILEFDPSGKFLASFGSTMFAFPHGFTIDAQGNVWASDANASETVLGISAKDANGIVRGHQVLKFSAAGKVLMTLGKRGSPGMARHLRSTHGDRDRPRWRYLRDRWPREERPRAEVLEGRAVHEDVGPSRVGAGEFDQPHDISIGGSKAAYLSPTVAIAGSRYSTRTATLSRVEAVWPPSTVYVSKDDALYVSDSQSNSSVNPGYPRGITVGSARDVPPGFHPDPIWPRPM